MSDEKPEKLEEQEAFIYIGDKKIRVNDIKSVPSILSNEEAAKTLKEVIEGAAVESEEPDEGTSPSGESKHE